MAKSYCDYMQEAFLVEWLPFHSLKTTERTRRPQKVHAVDTGLRNAVCVSTSEDRGRLIETSVHAAMRRTSRDLFYWAASGELDLLERRGRRVAPLVQCCHQIGEDHDILAREIASLQEASRQSAGAKAVLVVERNPPKTAVPRDIETVPLWRFLLDWETAPR
ncbi:MAG: DUF4143 domain-containing protein [Planctomycetota bacterium]